MIDAVSSRERVRAALEHREPDRIPLDLGGTRVSGIHIEAYRRLRGALGLGAREPVVADVAQQLAAVDADVADALGVDVRGIEPAPASGYEVRMHEDASGRWYRDEFGVERRMAHGGGPAYSPSSSPLAGDIDTADVVRYPWPDPGDAARYADMAGRARAIAETERRAVYLGSICAGLTELHFRLRGYEDGYIDLAADPALARRLMEQILRIKLAYWDRALAIVGDQVDVVGEADDLGGQDRLLFSPATYRAVVKPLHAELFRFIRSRTSAKLFFHCCGAIRDVIPDLIEIGVDILNPVQVSSRGMDTAELKREFGPDLVFWGGGIDTQRVLAHGTPDDVRAEVRRRVADLRSDGGFVFATVHNIQANVPTGNLLALYDTLREARDRAA